MSHADAVRDLIHAGADAVAVGTLLLRADEAGTSETHRAALKAGAGIAGAGVAAASGATTRDTAAGRGARGTETVMTRAFTGRYARALRNGFINRHDAHAIGSYPEVHHLTRAIRQRAAATGDAERLHLWAGTGYAAGRDAPVADILAELTKLL